MFRIRSLVALSLVAVLAACISLPQKPPVVTPQDPPPVVAPPPVVTPEPEPPAPPVPFENLNVRVLDAAQAAIAGATVVNTRTAETRTADGSGFVNFGIQAFAIVNVSAPGFVARTGINLPPGDHNVNLARVFVPPPVVVQPKPGDPIAACGARPNPIVDRLECVRQVAAISPNWFACTSKGNAVSCHLFTREVARALAAGDPRVGYGWGLISKPRGQQSCSETACGPNVGGYGEDVVAWLPKDEDPRRWLGGDIVGGAGEPGARFQWPTVFTPENNRPDNLWAPVPK